MTPFGLFGPPDVGKLKANRDVQGLIRLLREGGPWFPRTEAADALGELAAAVEDPALRAHMVAAFISALSDGVPAVRMAAATALGDIGDVQALPPLIASVRDENSYVRTEAVRALGRLGDPRAVEPLIYALNNDDAPSVRHFAAEALRHIGSRSTA